VRHTLLTDRAVSKDKNNFSISSLRLNHNVTKALSDYEGRQDAPTNNVLTKGIDEYLKSGFALLMKSKDKSSAKK